MCNLTGNARRDDDDVGACEGLLDAFTVLGEITFYLLPLIRP
jgi:hypothetical protein